MVSRPGGDPKSLSLTQIASLLGVGVSASLIGCTRDPCEGLRTFAPPPEPALSPSSPPTVIDGQWLNASVLELQFSEPIASEGDPDPERFAILGWNVDIDDYGYGDNSCSTSTRYSSLGGGGYSYYYYSPAPSIAQAWIGPEDDSILRLQLSSISRQCPSSAGTVASGVLLVYTDSELGGPALTDAEGTKLGDIGPAWALTRLESCVDSDSSYSYGCSINGFYTGQLPQLSSLLEIPCPS